MSSNRAGAVPCTTQKWCGRILLSAKPKHSCDAKLSYLYKILDEQSKSAKCCILSTAKDVASRPRTLSVCAHRKFLVALQIPWPLFPRNLNARPSNNQPDTFNHFRVARETPLTSSLFCLDNPIS